MMFNLTDNLILAPYQSAILKQFFSYPEAASFFLTGGTALSAFYFAHRESKDLDLFSIESFEMQKITDILNTIAVDFECELSVAVATPTYREIYLSKKNKMWTQRIDIVREQPKITGEILTIEGIRIDSLENIGSNKILAVFGRLEGKDYVDLYTILTQSAFTFETLFELAKQKDTGLSQFYFANTIANVSKIKIWPVLKTDVNIQEIVTYFEDLSKKLFLAIKP